MCRYTSPHSILIAIITLGFPQFLMGDAQSEVKSVTLPDIEPVLLEPIARIENEAINESSGIIKSQTHDGIFWTHNDSGDEARIFPLRIDGTSHDLKRPEREMTGIHILAAGNVDWEDIALDKYGNLILIDCGNNSNARRDLMVYLIPEPVPYIGPSQSHFYKRIPIRYLDQNAYPPENLNFDCEAVFFARRYTYLLTKHRSDLHTKLYRMDTSIPSEMNPLTFIDRFDIQGQVTGADASLDGERLAVLTYRKVEVPVESKDEVEGESQVTVQEKWLGGIWVFDQSDGSDHFFDGEIYYLPAWTRSGEAICWENDESLIITNEQRDIFRVRFDQLVKVR